MWVAESVKLWGTILALQKWNYAVNKIRINLLVINFQFSVISCLNTLKKYILHGFPIAYLILFLNPVWKD